MITRTKYDARQSGIAWRLFRISFAINLILIAGIIFSGCFSIIFNNPTYTAADSNLHFNRLKQIRNVNPNELQLVDQIYTDIADGSVSEKEEKSQ